MGTLHSIPICLIGGLPHFCVTPIPSQERNLLLQCKVTEERESEVAGSLPFGKLRTIHSLLPEVEFKTNTSSSTLQSSLGAWYKDLVMIFGMLVFFWSRKTLFFSGPEKPHITGAQSGLKASVCDFLCVV